MQVLRIHTVSPEWAEETYDEIQYFYKENRDKFNTIRDEEVLLKAIRDHNAFLVSDKEHGEMYGVSFCFPQGDGKFIETGGTNINKKKRGYRLQVVLSHVKVMHIFIKDPPTHDYYCVIKNNNGDSIRNMLEACFVEWEPTEELLELRKNSPLEGKHFYKLPRDKLTDVKHKLLYLIKNPIIPHSRGLAPPIKVEFDVGIITSGAFTEDTTFDHLDDE